ncbi:unnamed protein product [Penicillium salamii]|uniref:Uncharacterized protein n=1 Tax=Penicillium salamii TaxID=1612424 RepID=A0A9W4IUG1_9EURO|nr:unnamed protein product [Penicillium salamii]CAG8122704.1 unnamed protein product [Penicillium salamii]CAG8288388.1 unnamed protein product [Penicillium salamii]CAG8341025.1 unnamed protein product [Penicillium salamii]CAG8342879.1 unnamed protein product [Penicillium salamii]
MCIKVGRVCEYKETPDRRTRDMRQARGSPVDVIARRLVDPSQAGLTPTERHYLQLFRAATSGQCAGNIVDEFWQRLIHRVSEQEPAVRHATIAISAIHWLFLREENASSQSTPRSCSLSNPSSPNSGSLSPPSSMTHFEGDISFPLQQCNKAIASLRENLTKVHTHVTSSAHREAVLVTCAALVSLALFQEDVKAVMKHLESGHRLLLEWQKVDYDGNSSGPILMRVFQDLQLHRMTFSSRETSVGQVHTPIWQNFTKACETYSHGYAEKGTASELLVILGTVVSANFPRRLHCGKMSKLNSLIKNATELLAESKDGVPTTVMGRLLVWKNHLNNFVVDTAGKLTPAELTPLVLIEIWTEFIHLMAIYANSPQNEMLYDAYLPNFQRINKLAALFLKAEYQTGIFCAKVMLLPPIYFSAHRCRDWYTRRESLRLISSSRRREGFWASAGATAVLSHFINEESIGLGPDDVIPIYSRIDMMYVYPSPDKLKGNVWYHRPASPEEIAFGADDRGIWKKLGVPTW